MSFKQVRKDHADHYFRQNSREIGKSVGGFLTMIVVVGVLAFAGLELLKFVTNSFDQIANYFETVKGE